MLKQVKILLCAALLILGDRHFSQAQIGSFENPPINYHEATVNDPIAELTAKIESGEAKLTFDEKQGYLKSLLDALDIPSSSQTLVFSKTSLQLQRISPLRPRALYFNDDTYIGWCQRGDIIEIATTDPQQGAIFYSLKQQESEKPTFVRDKGQCLVCHASSRTQNVPGFLVRSVFANRAGHAILGSGTFTTDHTSPFNERWGGWYVSGIHGRMRHMGNKIFKEGERNEKLDEGANLESLDELITTKPYLTPHSDIVALMVLEHQTQMHNAITAANFETRQALHQSFEMNKLLEREPDFISESAQRRINKVAAEVVKQMLMCNEFELEDAVRGTSRFATEFMARGRKDSKNRSLRELDLKHRLFRYPCSYLIYSPSFDGLPDEVRHRIIKAMLDVLGGREKTDDFAHLTPKLRREILEIIVETKPEFAERRKID